MKNPTPEPSPDPLYTQFNRECTRQMKWQDRILFALFLLAVFGFGAFAALAIPPYGF